MGRAEAETRRLVKLSDLLLSEWPVMVTYGPHTFGVVAYPERVNEYRRALFAQQAREGDFKAALTTWLKGLISSWAVTEAGAPVPVSAETISRLSSGARWAIFAAIAHEAEQVRQKAS